MAVFNRIPMDIIDMAVVVFLVFDQMRPKAALSQTAFTAFLAAFGNTLAIRYVSRKMAF
jgi:hypothetical protein